MARKSVRISTSFLATLVLAACSSDGGTNNQDGGNDTPATPTTLVVVSGNNQTGTVDQELPAPAKALGKPTERHLTSLIRFRDPSVGNQERRHFGGSGGFVPREASDMEGADQG